MRVLGGDQRHRIMRLAELAQHPGAQHGLAHDGAVLGWATARVDAHEHTALAISARHARQKLHAVWHLAAGISQGVGWLKDEATSRAFSLRGQLTGGRIFFMK